MTVSPWSLQAAISIRHKAPNAAWNSLRDFALRARASRSTSRGGYASTVVRNPFDRRVPTSPARYSDTPPTTGRYTFVTKTIRGLGGDLPPPPGGHQAGLGSRGRWGGGA